MMTLQEEIHKALYGDSLPTARINRSNFVAIRRADGTVDIKRFEGIRWVVTCDICEFYRPCSSQSKAEVIRIGHLTTAHSQDVMNGQATYYLSKYAQP